jgi:hypothetical protein
MEHIMRKTILAAAAAFAVAGAAQAQQAVTTVLTSPEPQTQLMAMVLTMQAINAGASAHVLLCGPAADIALKAPPASATAPQKPRDASPRSMLEGIMAKGAGVEVCAIYLPNKGVGPEALMDGVTPAQPPEMAKRMLDSAVWSF